MSEDHPTVVFDTDCVLCSGMVAFILKHERDHALHFLGAWSSDGVQTAARYGFTRADLHETFLFIRDGTALTRSDAGLAVLRHLRAPWRWLTSLGVVPRRLRDAAYGLVARRRYRWFGRRADCTIVPPQHAHRFIGVRSGDWRAQRRLACARRVVPVTYQRRKLIEIPVMSLLWGWIETFCLLPLLVIVNPAEKPAPSTDVTM